LPTTDYDRLYEKKGKGKKGKRRKGKKARTILHVYTTFFSVRCWALGVKY
jgi:hypothetical protein